MKSKRLRALEKVKRQESLAKKHGLYTAAQVSLIRNKAYFDAKNDVISALLAAVADRISTKNTL